MSASLAVSIACLAPLSPALPEVVLAAAPEAGTSTSLAIRTELELQGGELTVLMNGEEVPSMFLPQLDYTMTERRTVAFTDSWTEVGAGAATWVRSYDELAWTNDGAMTMVMGADEQEFPWTATADTPLSGAEVRFSVSADGEVARELVDDDGDANLLAGLDAHVDLRELLPAGLIEVGGWWSVDGEALGLLFVPGGDFAWELPDEAVAQMQPEIREREHGGELELHLRSLDEEGRAHCEVTGALTRTTVQPGDLTQVPVADGTATDTVEELWELSGELVWDTRSNQVVLLELEGDLEQEVRTVRDPGQEGPDYESTFAVAGSYSIVVEGQRIDE